MRSCAFNLTTVCAERFERVTSLTRQKDTLQLCRRSITPVKGRKKYQRLIGLKVDAGCTDRTPIAQVYTGYQVPGTWYDAAVVRTGMICQGVKGASPPTWAVSAGPKDNNLEVKLYWDNVHGMLV